MKKLLIIAGMVGAFVLGVCTPAFTQADHPRIRAAHHHLEEARHELQDAARDYRGHRAKALDTSITPSRNAIARWKCRIRV